MERRSGRPWERIVGPATVPAPKCMARYDQAEKGMLEGTSFADLL
ncbi:hypothetical protein D3OALGA1CA_4337 [Olavius algarvensis associated proteobacterium Delta 3]|nr:hypothetical protein D3OALGB2SA_151 [Olavius algarvensis associated proteobacterium Delta 3]CAB5149420.1 hypothetical protein D3OALGA1CA_4337 [Olavius algarvensis associated proteobacterium Delta 3]